MPAGAAAVEIEARFDAPVAAEGEVVGFWIEVRSGLPRAAAIEPRFELDNLEVLGRPDRSESFRSLNGVTSRTVRLTWTLRPLGTGSAAVRGIRVQVGHEVFDLPSRRIEVVPGPLPGVRPRPRSGPLQRLPSLAPRRPPPPPSPPGVFLRAEVVPARPWVGQQVVYTLYLYTQADISSIHPRQIPSFQGFWAREVELPPQQTPEMVDVGDRRYGRVPLLERVLFARRPGELTVEAATFDLVAQVQESAPLGSPFRRPQQLRRSSEPVVLTVRSLPPPPPGFSGAVGSFTLAARLEPRRVAVGEAATLTVTFEGDGHIQSLPAPAPPRAAGVAADPAEESGREEMGASGLVGRRTWRFVLVPRTAGDWRLEPFELHYFDVRSGSYRLAASPPLHLEATPPPPRIAAREADPETAGAAAAEDDADAVVGRARGWRVAAWWLAPSAALLLTLWLLRRRFGGSSGDPSEHRLIARLKALDPDLEADGSTGHRRAAAALEKAWGEYLEARWGLPPEVPPARWAARLATIPEAGPEAAEALAELAGELDYLRHAPQLAATSDLYRALLRRSLRLIHRLP